jgi:Holliday junction resolvasome RuvABC DNA-binding subunit
MARLTAQQALRNVLAAGWKSDALARDTAIQALVEDGYDQQAAERAVDKALPAFNITGAM